MFAVFSPLLYRDVHPSFDVLIPEAQELKNVGTHPEVYFVKVDFIALGFKQLDVLGVISCLFE